MRAAQGVVNSIVVQPVFAGERAVCYRERAAGMYAVLPFSLSLVRAQAPLVHTPWVTQRQARLDQRFVRAVFQESIQGIINPNVPGHCRHMTALPRRWAWSCCTMRCRRCCTRSSCSTWSALT